MTRWTDCPGDGPVVTKKVENLSERERRHLDHVIKRGHIKSEFAKMRQADYTRRHSKDKRKAREKVMVAIEGELVDGFTIINQENGEWPTQK